MKYKSNNNIVYSCKYHVVFCPKYRRKVLNNGVDERLKELINNICQELPVDLIEMEVMPDHVHLFLDVDPQFGIHKVVKRIKGMQKRWGRKISDYGFMEGWDINLLWRDIVRPAILVGKYRLYPRIPCI